jgi:hypothetical protein
MLASWCNYYGGYRHVRYIGPHRNALRSHGTFKMPETISPVLRPRHCRVSRTYRFLWLCLVLAFYYYLYRYPFQINDSGTSPTYSDTPLIVQLGKYIIFLCICLWFILGVPRFRILERDLMLFIATACFASISLLLALINALQAAEPFGPLRTAQDSIFLAIPLFSMGCGTRWHIDKIVRLIWVFLWLSMISLVLQVVLFITTDRLPALAYHDSLSVRFGSIWDDSNAFPMMLALFVPLILFRFTSIAATIFTVVVTVMVIVAAQSLTCAVSVAICFMAALVLRLSDHISAAGLATKACIILFVLPLTIAVIDIGALKSIIVAWQQEKAPSIAAHILDFDRYYAQPLSFLGLAPAGVKGECGWLNLLLNQGILLTALYSMFIITGIVQAATAALDCSIQEKGLFYGAFCFQVAFAVSLFILPNNLVFPLNMIDYILWSIVYMWRRARRESFAAIRV